MAARSFNESHVNSQAQIWISHRQGASQFSKHEMRRFWFVTLKTAFQTRITVPMVGCSSSEPVIVPGMKLRSASFGQSGEALRFIGSGSRPWEAHIARVFCGTARHKVFSGLFTLLLATSLLASAESSRRISFRNDVMAVLSKAGCNAGQCHGNANGKAGFKLSLRGQDPDWDYKALTRDMFGRRTDPEEADQSLILLKPTTQIAHEGGQRFKQDSEEYQILRAWIVEGMPSDPPNAAT